MSDTMEKHMKDGLLPHERIGYYAKDGVLVPVDTRLSRRFGHSMTELAKQAHNEERKRRGMPLFNFE